MPIQIVTKPHEVANRLDELGTSHKMLIEVVQAVAAARADCTDNDPFGTRGWRGWQMGTRRLREIHFGIDDWEKSDVEQIASMFSNSRGIRIVVCNTDDGTCIKDRNPQNRSRKGAATDRVVDANQGSFISELEESIKENQDENPVIDIDNYRKSPEKITTYYLCVYVEGDDIRGELSCPVNVINGYFDDFVEKIFLIGGEAGGQDPARRKSDDDGGESEYSIPVKRKK